MTSVPKPLKFLRPHYGTLKAAYATVASENKVRPARPRGCHVAGGSRGPFCLLAEWNRLPLYLLIAILKKVGCDGCTLGSGSSGRRWVGRGRGGRKESGFDVLGDAGRGLRSVSGVKGL